MNYVRKEVVIFDFILRICALVAALAAATTTGNSPFQFQAQLTSLLSRFLWWQTGLLVDNLAVSLLFSIVGIVRPHARGPKLLLIIFDTVLVTFTTSVAASATAVVCLAHNGNSNTKWLAICQQFNNGAVVDSCIAAVIFIFLVLLSAVTLSRR